MCFIIVQLSWWRNDMHLLFKNIKETLWFYNFTFKLTIFCVKMLTIYLSATRWHEAQSIYTLLWHTLLSCHIDTRCINSIDWMLHSCIVVLTLCSHPGWDKKKQPASFTPLARGWAFVQSQPLFRQSGVKEVKCLLEVFDPPPPPGMLRLAAASQTQTLRGLKKKKKTLTKELIKSDSQHASIRGTA